MVGEVGEMVVEKVSLIMHPAEMRIDRSVFLCSAYAYAQRGWVAWLMWVDD